MAKKEKVQKPLYKKWWFWVVAVSLVGAVGTGLFGGGTTDAGPSDAPPPPAETQKAETKQEPEAPPAETSQAPADSTPETQEPPAETGPEPATPSDWEIITRDGHPTFYGSVEDSHSIWDDVEKGKIIFPDGYDRWGDNTILSMEAYRDSDLIREVYVSLENFNISSEKTLDEILPVIATYMPYEVMDEYYEFNYSCSYEPDEGKEVTDKYYVVSYALTDEAKEDYYKKEHEYSGTIDVIICVLENEQVKNFDIRFGTPRWMSSLKTNRMHKVPWECNLYDYRGADVS